MGECEKYFAETIKVIDQIKAKGVMTPEIITSSYLGSIAKSLAVIADKMCEEEVGDE